MLISNLLSPLFTPAPASPAGGSTSSSGGTTASGGTSQAEGPAATSTVPPTVPPRSSEPVQPTTASPASGSATSRAPDMQPSAEPERPEPRGGDDALQVYTRQLSSRGFRPAPVAGKIEAEIRRIEAVETAEITKSELIKQASVAMLAQANLRERDVLDILNV